MTAWRPALNPPTKQPQLHQPAIHSESKLRCERIAGRPGLINFGKAIQALQNQSAVGPDALQAQRTGSSSRPVIRQPAGKVAALIFHACSKRTIRRRRGGGTKIDYAEMLLAATRQTWRSDGCLASRGTQVIDGTSWWRQTPAWG